MDIIDLKLSGASLPFKCLQYSDLAKYYDQAFLINPDNPSFVGFITQELHNEPYMDIDFDDVDLINYRLGGSLEAVLNLMDQEYKRPQITRATDDNLEWFKESGWKHIPNKDGSIAILRKARRYILPEETFQVSPQIRLCQKEDLPLIGELFRKEYPLRYRLVQYMFDQDPEANLVFGSEAGVIGVTFNERQQDYLYCRQLFVKSHKRQMGIGTKLCQAVMKLATDNNLYVVFANVREGTEHFHARQRVKLLDEKEFYLFRTND